MSDLAPLKGARIWLSGAMPEGIDHVEAKRFTAFLERISALIFMAGGSIVHGSHPTVVGALLRSATIYQDPGGAKGKRDCLVLAASKFHYEKYKSKLDRWRENSVVHEEPVDGDEDKSMARLRHWMADHSDAVIAVGGRRWKLNPAAAGIPREFDLARERGLPCFLLAGLSAAAAGYLQANSKALDNLKNGLTEADNRNLAEEQDVEVLANRVVDQLARLPLVRGELLGDSTFRILSLDGGGIKGAFTAAVLARWEQELKDKNLGKLTDYFDLIAGTSTGGILALGLGMGLEAADILKFYVERGPIVFPITSLGRKVGYTVRQIFTAKYPQTALREQLDAAFAKAPHQRIGDSDCRLVIPAVHAKTGSVHVFRTNHRPNHTFDKNRRATDVGLATAAAPTYFRAADIDDGTFVDGGVWANNPSMAALAEAVSGLRVPLNRIDILSIGTTSAPYAGRKTAKSGYFGWLSGGGRIINLFMHAQAQGTMEFAYELAGRPRVLRIDEMLAPGDVSLDDINRIDELRQAGMRAAQNGDTFADVKARFLNGVKVDRWQPY